MHTHDELQKQRINQLNQAIETGLMQLDSENKISASKAYQRLKKKLKK